MHREGGVKSEGRGHEERGGEDCFFRGGRCMRCSRRVKTVKGAKLHTFDVVQVGAALRSACAAACQCLFKDI